MRFQPTQKSRSPVQPTTGRRVASNLCYLKRRPLPAGTRNPMTTYLPWSRVSLCGYYASVANQKLTHFCWCAHKTPFCSGRQQHGVRKAHSQNIPDDLRVLRSTVLVAGCWGTSPRPLLQGQLDLRGESVGDFQAVLWELQKTITANGVVRYA